MTALASFQAGPLTPDELTAYSHKRRSEGASIGQIARELDRPKSTVQSALSRVPNNTAKTPVRNRMKSRKVHADQKDHRTASESICGPFNDHLEPSATDVVRAVEALAVLDNPEQMALTISGRVTAWMCERTAVVLQMALANAERMHEARVGTLRESKRPVDLPPNPTEDVSDLIGPMPAFLDRQGRSS